MNNLKVVLALLLILGLIYLLWYLARRYGRGTLGMSNVSKSLHVVERCPITQDKSVVVVRVGERYFLLGVSAQRLELISELEQKDAVWNDSAGTNPDGYPDGNIVFKGLGGKIFNKQQENKGFSDILNDLKKKNGGDGNGEGEDRPK